MEESHDESHDHDSMSHELTAECKEVRTVGISCCFLAGCFLLMLFNHPFTFTVPVCYITNVEN